MTEGRVFALKRFAVHDGPGIRTTLFLKGCPLRCRWCHNPEGLGGRPELAVRRHRCSFCGECAAVCEYHRVDAGTHTLDRAACRACGNCVEACTAGALELYGETMAPERAAFLLAEDRAFYTESGGGATISGGEPLLQADFCREVLRLLKDGGIDTAVDSCGEVPWEAFEAVLPHTDRFLYDFKHADPRRHEFLTGRDNLRIVENLRRLAATGKPVEIRMVMIPGHNMDKADLETAARVFAGLAVAPARLRLLALHAFAGAKYESLDLPAPDLDARPPAPEEMAQAADFLRERTGLAVWAD